MTHFSAQPGKKTFPEKIYNIFQKKAFLIFRENRTLHNVNSAQTQKRKIHLRKIEISYYTLSLKRKLFLYFREPKLCRNFLYFIKKKTFLISWGMQTPKKLGTLWPEV